MSRRGGFLFVDLNLACFQPNVLINCFHSIQINHCPFPVLGHHPSQYYYVLNYYLEFFSGLSLEDRLRSHISTFDPVRMFQIPNPTMSQFSSSFRHRNLAQRGMDNDGNICCLISILLSINRMLLPRFFINRDAMVDVNQAPDFPSIILSDILK